MFFLNFTLQLSTFLSCINPQPPHQVEALINDLSGAFFQAVKGLFDAACEPIKDDDVSSQETNHHLRLDEGRGQRQDYSSSSSSAFGQGDVAFSLSRVPANKEPAGKAAPGASAAAAEATVAALARVVAAADALEKAALTASVPVYLGDAPQALSLPSSSGGGAGSGGSSSGLRDGAAEVVEAVVRSELEVAFRGLRTQTLASLHLMHAQQAAGVRIQLGLATGDGEEEEEEATGEGGKDGDKDSDDDASTEAAAAVAAVVDGESAAAVVAAQRKLERAFMNGEKVNLPSVVLSGFEQLLRAVEVQCMHVHVSK